MSNFKKRILSTFFIKRPPDYSSLKPIAKCGEIIYVLSYLFATLLSIPYQPLLSLCSCVLFVSIACPPLSVNLFYFFYSENVAFEYHIFEGNVFSICGCQITSKFCRRSLDNLIKAFNTLRIEQSSLHLKICDIIFGVCNSSHIFLAADLLLLHPSHQSCSIKSKTRHSHDRFSVRDIFKSYQTLFG